MTNWQPVCSQPGGVTMQCADRQRIIHCASEYASTQCTTHSTYLPPWREGLGQHSAILLSSDSEVSEKCNGENNTHTHSSFSHCSPGGTGCVATHSAGVVSRDASVRCFETSRYMNTAEKLEQYSKNVRLRENLCEQE